MDKIPYSEFEEAIEDIQDSMKSLRKSWRTVIFYVSQEEDLVEKIQDQTELDKATDLINEKVYSPLQAPGFRLKELVDQIKRNIVVLDL